MPQSRRNRLQRRHVGDVPGPHLRAHRASVLVQHQTQNHLMAVRTTVLRVPMAPDRLAAPAGEDEPC